MAVLLAGEVSTFEQGPMEPPSLLLLTGVDDLTDATWSGPDLGTAPSAWGGDILLWPGSSLGASTGPF